MPGETKPAAKPAINPADYDIGNTDLDMRQPDGLPVESVVQARNSDGTFAKPAPAHPPWLTEMATDFGFTDEDMAAMTTESLGRSVRRMRTLDVARQQQLSRENAIVNPPPAPPPPEPEPQVDLGLDEAQFGTELVGAIKKARLDSLKENQALKKELAEIKAAQARRQQTESANFLDSAFDKLGKDYAHIYGEGSGMELSEDNPDAVSRRIECIRALSASKVNVFGMSAKALAAKIKAYADKLYKIEPKKPAQTKVDPYAAAAETFTEEEWAEAGTAKPTHRTGAAEPHGEQKAIRRIEEKRREAGVNGSVPSASELDGFL